MPGNDAGTGRLETVGPKIGVVDDRRNDKSGGAVALPDRKRIGSGGVGDVTKDATVTRRSVGGEDAGQRMRRQGYGVRG